MSGCSSPDEATPAPVSVCAGPDVGDEHLRLAIAWLSDGGLLDAGTSLLIENGTFLIVDDRCRYWVSGSGLWDEVRAGDLAPPLREEFASDMLVDRWQALAGWWPQAPGAVHYPNLLLRLDEAVVFCQGTCDGEVVPGAVQASPGRSRIWLQRLWDLGRPIEGPVRVIADAPNFPNPDVYPSTVWDLDAPLASIVVEPSSAMPGQGIRFEGEDADRLRTLRNDHVADAFGREFDGYGFLPVLDEAGTLHRLYVRDTVPAEGPDGLIGFIRSAP